MLCFEIFVIFNHKVKTLNHNIVLIVLTIIQRSNK